MKLVISTTDYRILEDEFGNPVFQHVGDHPGDVRSLISYINRLEDQIDRLKRDIEEYEDRIHHRA